MTMLFSLDSRTYAVKGAKKRKLIAKEKQNAQEFEAALGRMGLDFESEAHVCI